MAETAKFTALGMGNGFPFCLFAYPTTYDISIGSLPQFTTFAGITDQNYTSFTASEIELKAKESYAKLVELFWNYEGITATSTEDSETGIDFGSEPKDRVCETGVLDNEGDWMEVSTDYIKFYDGSTFLGYGGYYFNDFFPSNAEVATSHSRVSVCGLASSSLVTNANRVVSVSYETVNGIDFLFVGVASTLSGRTGTVTLTETTLNATSDSDVAEISSVNFYTYPS